MFNSEQIAAFQNSGIECFVNSLNKPTLLACFQRFSAEKKTKLITDISDYIESELGDTCGKKKQEKIEELTDTNSI